MTKWIKPEMDRDILEKEASALVPRICDAFYGRNLAEVLRLLTRYRATCEGIGWEMHRKHTEEGSK